ncbi:EAL domain-containing protein [Blastococcus sp. BMG 814]|uniref:EAL domain-containing protein n=1 Tax=Blastococcus carthaginiensis TaxID=3050034 RepID=A0ABT9IHK4_9ACTN|nr:EAL domain-containing protein [Blastococcus carthaginiensis]MDP5185060.1 EAL domain-containing protein [Blastococcus carthaginiensis]
MTGTPERAGERSVGDRHPSRGPAGRAAIAVSVDDAGAGYASLRHILRLDPDVIELDIGLATGLHTDPARQAMTWAPGEPPGHPDPSSGV